MRFEKNLKQEQTKKLEKLKLKIGEWIKKMRDTMKKNIEEGDGYWKHWQG